MNENKVNHIIRFSKISKIGLKHLKRKTNKLWITIVLCLLSSTFLLNSIVSFSFNERNFIKNEYNKSNDNYIALVKDSEETTITKKDIEVINDLTNNSFLKGINVRMESSSIGAGDKFLSVSKFDNFMTSNFLEYNDSLFYKNIDLIAGTKPQAINEILITDYTYQMFKSFYYITPNSRELVYIMNYEDILNKQMVFNDLVFEIKGIVNTSFNYKKYEPLKNYLDVKSMPNNVDEKLYRFDYQNIIKYSIHTSIFVYDYDVLLQYEYIKKNKMDTNILVNTKVASNELDNLLNLKDYKIQHYVINKTETTSLTFLFIKVIILIVGILFLIFSFLTQISYICLSIDKSKTEIKILNSVGFRHKEIKYIFGFETMFISVSGSAISVFFGLVSSAILNALFYHWYLVYSGVVIFSFWQPLVVLFFNVAFSLLALLISFKRKISLF